jgi:hypothetical protein
MTSFGYEITYLQACVPQLEAYLLSVELYWPLDVSAPAGERPYPSMTLGNLLLSRTRAWALPLSSSEQAEMRSLDQQIEAIRTHWRTAWGKKANEGFLARLNLWRNFLEDYKEHPQANVDRYAYEVERRVMLKLLSPETESLQQAYRDMLAGLDLRLKSSWVPGEFIWDAQLAPGFPPDEYWYLYGTLAS